MPHNLRGNVKWAIRRTMRVNVVSHFVSVNALITSRCANELGRKMEKCQQQSPLVWVNPLRFPSKNPSERRVSRCILRCGWNALNIVSWQAAVLVCGMFRNYIFKHALCCRGTFATNLLRSRCSAPRWSGGSSAPPAPAEAAARTPGAGWTKPAGKSAQLDMQTFNQDRAASQPGITG